MLRLQNRQIKTYSGTVAETATVSAANVTINNARYSAIVQVTLVGRSALGLPHGGGIGTFLVSRVDGGATVTELSRTSSASGVVLESCSTSDNTVSIRVRGTNNGTSTSYNYLAEVSVIVDNFTAISLS